MEEEVAALSLGERRVFLAGGLRPANRAMWVGHYDSWKSCFDKPILWLQSPR